MATSTIVGPDGRPRCRWAGAAPEFIDYHDREMAAVSSGLDGVDTVVADGAAHIGPRTRIQPVNAKPSESE